MSTMYIACNHCTKNECFLGDVITMIKSASLFVENEPHQNLLLSLFKQEPLNFLWQKFVETHRVRILWDDFPEKTPRIYRRYSRTYYYHKDMRLFYRRLHERIKSRQVNDTNIDTYKELYPWRLWLHRQRFLCGSPRFSKGMNIFEGYYYGQQDYVSQPKGIKRFLPGLIEYNRGDPMCKRSVFIAPHEQCQMNRIFTLKFWGKVASLLLKENVRVILNTDSFMTDIQHPRLKTTFVPLPKLINQIALQRLVVCGNTGVGWVAAATGTPFIAMEKNMINKEYSYEKCGCRSLLDTVRKPNPLYAVRTILKHLYTT